MQTKVHFMNLENWYFGFGKVWRSFGNIIKGVYTNPELRII